MFDLKLNFTQIIHSDMLMGTNWIKVIASVLHFKIRPLELLEQSQDLNKRIIT